jgi:hypothetical protein
MGSVSCVSYRDTIKPPEQTGKIIHRAARDATRTHAHTHTHTYTHNIENQSKSKVFDAFDIFDDRVY